jgi:hypothetical protein
MVTIMQGYAKAFKRAKELFAQIEGVPPDERAATFLFAAVISQYEYERTGDVSLPERMSPQAGVAMGHHLADILPLLGMSAGMIKSDAHMEDLISGMRPEEMPNYGS